MTCGTHTLSDCICFLPLESQIWAWPGTDLRKSQWKTGRFQSSSLVEYFSNETWPLVEIAVPKREFHGCSEMGRAEYSCTHDLAGVIIIL